MDDEIELDAHNFLRATYLNQDLPVGTRMRAATVAIQFERPKLAAMEVHHHRGDLGDRLDRAIAKHEALKLARGQGLLIEGKVIKEEEPTGSSLRRL